MPTLDSPSVDDITLDADGILLSGLLAQPRHTAPRAVVVAVHGGGMRAGYFHSGARPGMSLLALGAELGYTVLALDRPGYGLSADRFPQGQTLAEQSVTLNAALSRFADRNPIGEGFFLVAHSYGGKLALSTAEQRSDAHDLLGLDISGLGHRYADDVRQFPGPGRRGDWQRHWGALRFYPPDAFRLAQSLLAPVPARESREAAEWPVRYPGIAARVRVPVRLTFAEQERWWRHDDAAVSELTGFLAAPHVRVDRQPGAGHNISLGWAARTYHLRALAFLEECLLARDVVPPGGAGRAARN
ncbi:alpha/beta hydrolase family protein [Streptomyces sp. NPDC001315]|uniref:alpha/beta hydrolase family protein n=1 Tax=Streptomyces sp. NPDC001315 TaxID=3364562 RepID=UPI0036AC551C